MFGTLRLLLAVMVALSHAGVSLRGYHLGVPAVVVFLLLSGYVVAAMLYPRQPLHRFYAERALRLLPPYYAAFALGVACWLAGVASPFLQGATQPVLWLAALLVAPLNYATLWPVLDTFTPVPPAWSLGLELQFYLLAPWLLARPVRVLAAAGVTWLIGSLAQLGVLPSDAWGYRLLAGNLYIFLSGSLLWHLRHTSAFSQRTVQVLWTAVLAVAATAGLLGRWGQPFVLEVTVGYLIGIPLVALLGALPRRSWDDRMADLAYPLFLVHFAALWALQMAGLQPGPQAPRAMAAYIGLALLAALVLHWVAQRPVVQWRRRLRQAPAPTIISPAAQR